MFFCFSMWEVWCSSSGVMRALNYTSYTPQTELENLATGNKPETGSTIDGTLA